MIAVSAPTDDPSDHGPVRHANRRSDESDVGVPRVAGAVCGIQAAPALPQNDFSRVRRVLDVGCGPAPTPATSRASTTPARHQRRYIADARRRIAATSASPTSPASRQARSSPPTWSSSTVSFTTSTMTRPTARCRVTPARDRGWQVHILDLVLPDDVSGARDGEARSRPLPAPGRRLAVDFARTSTTIFEPYTYRRTLGDGLFSRQRDDVTRSRLRFRSTTRKPLFRSCCGACAPCSTAFQAAHTSCCSSTMAARSNGAAARGGRRDDPRIRIVVLSRNFGHQAAFSAALAHVSGDAIVLMDGDLQDAPEAIPEFLERYREGYEVVYARRVRRKEGVVLRTAYRLSYRLIAWSSDITLPLDAGDFALLSRRVVELSRAAGAPALPARPADVGRVPSDRRRRRAPRALGRAPKYTLSRLAQLAFDGLLAFSVRRFGRRRWSARGVALSTVFAVYAIYVRIVLGHSPEGFTALLVAFTFLSGIQLFFMGVIGESIGRIYEETRVAGRSSSRA